MKSDPGSEKLRNFRLRDSMRIDTLLAFVLASVVSIHPAQATSRVIARVKNIAFLASLGLADIRCEMCVAKEWKRRRKESTRKHGTFCGVMRSKKAYSR